MIICIAYRVDICTFQRMNFRRRVYDEGTFLKKIKTSKSKREREREICLNCVFLTSLIYMKRFVIQTGHATVQDSNCKRTVGYHS